LEAIPEDTKLSFWFLWWIRSWIVYWKLHQVSF